MIAPVVTSSPLRYERSKGQPCRGDYGDNPNGIVWCPNCESDTFPHDTTGRCMWCDLLLARHDKRAT